MPQIGPLKKMAPKKAKKTKKVTRKPRKAKGKCK